MNGNYLTSASTTKVHTWSLFSSVHESNWTLLLTSSLCSMNVHPGSIEKPSSNHPPDATNVSTRYSSLVPTHIPCCISSSRMIYTPWSTKWSHTNSCVNPKPSPKEHAIDVPLVCIGMEHFIQTWYLHPVWNCPISNTYRDCLGNHIHTGRTCKDDGLRGA